MDRAKLTTAQATDWLAWRHDVNPPDDLVRAQSAGRDWRWTDAARYLRRAYESLGTVSPLVLQPLSVEGARWHRGDHPLQIVVSELKKVDTADLPAWADARPWVRS